MILRFEDAVALKCKAMFYLKRNKISILKRNYIGFLVHSDYIEKYIKKLTYV